MTHSRAVARRSVALLLVGLALLASSCADGLAFRHDRRLKITSPEARSRVSLPMQIEWRIQDFRITGADGSSDEGAGYFGLFLDRTPVPPGKPLTWIARDDRRCAQTPGCPDPVYLADRHVYSTDQTTFTFEQLPDLNTYSGRETHEVTIVLLDGMGNRIGESAWYVTFSFDRD